MIPTLLLLHMDVSRGQRTCFAGLDVAIELLLGLSMLMIVLDDSRERTERLSLVNKITSTIARNHEAGPLMLSCSAANSRSIPGRRAHGIATCCRTRC